MDTIRVSADLRWPAGTGIGICQHEHLSRTPENLELNGLAIKGGVGSPLSPLRVARALKVDKPQGDVFWSPGFVPPAWSSVPSVVTVHDLTHLHFYSSLHARYYDLVFKPLYQRCNAIICVSEYTRNEFLDWSGVQSSRVHVVHNGLSANFHADVKPHWAGYPYIFYPGNKRPYKNLQMMLRAYARSTLIKLGVRFVMTGVATPELQATIGTLGIAGNVVFLGFVPDDRLPGLYRGATFTAFISMYEGFGLPIVESMGVGTPVITSNVSSMPEIAAGAASVVSPRDCDEIVRAMDMLVSDSALRADLIARGFHRARDFSWDKAGADTWNIVRSAALKL
jgi:glycosyltransferase involved in cell wall biosynthesis